MKDIHHDINQVIAQVALQMKENKQSNDANEATANNPHKRNEILYYFQAMIHEMALTRKLLFSAQQALFEGVNGAP